MLVTGLQKLQDTAFGEPLLPLPPPAQACVVRNSNLKFTRLTADEIETQLTALAERDDDLVSRE